MCALILLLIIFPTLCAAQTTATFGITTPILCKINSGFNNSMRAELFGATGVGAALKVSGSDENSLTYLQVAGLNIDRLAFRVAPGHSLFIEQLQLDINPNVLIPSKWEKLKYSVGFGALFTLAQGGGSASYGQSYNSVIAFDADSAKKYIDEKTRRIVPYFKLGLVWEVHRNCNIEIMASQTLLNYFDEGAKFGYSLNYQYQEVPVGCQPAYFGLRFFYYF
ncbi:MAG: hypothetical protein K0Q79_3617 [Flavipsychrobacter sp.]|nr:hypothetical protein [Flavipsychrobacter sp.]